MIARFADKCLMFFDPPQRILSEKETMKHRNLDKTEIVKIKRLSTINKKHGNIGVRVFLPVHLQRQFIKPLLLEGPHMCSYRFCSRGLTHWLYQIEKPRFSWFPGFVKSLNHIADFHTVLLRYIKPTFQKQISESPEVFGWLAGWLAGCWLTAGCLANQIRATADPQ